jgi:hypothetical protein
MAKLMTPEKIQAKFEKLQLDGATRAYITKQFNATEDLIEEAREPGARWTPDVYIGSGGRCAMNTMWQDVYEDIERLVGERKAEKVFNAFFQE